MECWRLWMWCGRLLVEKLLELAVMVLERLVELEYLHRSEWEGSNITIDR